MKTEQILENIFNELKENAYDINYHKYYYKEANQIIRKHIEALLIHNVSKRYLFETPNGESDFTFEIEAKDFDEAYTKAYAQYGPQVEDMFYKEINDC